MTSSVPPPPRPPSSEAEAAAALAAGRRLLAAGRCDEAIRLLLEAARHAAANAEIAYQLGCAYLASGREAEAVEPLRRAAEDERYAAAANFQLGTAEAKLSRWSASAAAFASAVRLRPDWVTARLQLGAAFFRLGDVRGALEEAQAALRLEAGSAEAHRLYGVALYHCRSFAEAASEFKAWAEAAPSDALADLALARALLMAGARAGAKDACRRAVARDPNLVRGHFFLARLALRENRLGQAQAHLKRAIAARPQGASLRAMLARLLLRRSRPEAARKVAQAALTLDPDCDSAALLIAELHVVDGEFGQAWPILRRLAGRRPDWAELRTLDEQLGAARSPRRQGSESAAAAPPWGESARQRGGGRQLEEAPSVAREGGGAGGGGIVSPGPGLGAVAMSASPTFGRGDFLDQFFLLRALVLRQLRLHYRENRFGFVLEWVRPIIVMVLHAIVFNALHKRMPSKIPVELFVIGSFTIWFAFVHVARGCAHVRRQAAAIPGVSELHHDLARMSWEFLSMFSLAVLSVYLLMVFGFRLPFPNLPKTALYFVLATALGLGFGLVVRALARRFPATEMINKNFIWILYITSGHYYSIAYGRHGLAAYIWWNPLLHLSEFERQALYPGYPTELVALWYPVVVAAGLIIIGLVLDKCTRHLARD